MPGSFVYSKNATLSTNLSGKSAVLGDTLLVATSRKIVLK
jgi:hypothetical protein